MNNQKKINHKAWWSLGYMALLLVVGSCNTPSEGDDKLATMEQNFKDAASQYQYLMKQLEPGRYPKTFEGGALKTSNSSWWCSGFYPGSLLLIYEQTKDEALLEEAKRVLTDLEKEQYNKSTHDLGFMIHCSFGNAYRMTKDPAYQAVIKEASNSLITRFNPTIGCIRSWDAAPWNSQWQYPVIIDNMMNLEMLLWASENSGEAKYREVAQIHADTTLKNHFRSDFSSYHVLSYDTLSGAVEAKNTDQGYADESPWARGQAWGLYGYTVMYRYTKEQRYLDLATGIADFIVNHPRLPEDGVPYWDFDAPDIPDVPRDASAAAIISSALLELQAYVAEDKASIYTTLAEKALVTLSSPAYKAETGSNGGFLLKHGVGNMPDNSEVDVPLSYGDYYYLEAMSRYLNLFNQKMNG